MLLNPQLSVIVPAYNSEKYIADCINSILNQSYTSFELIVVDDGSTDKTYKICEKYMKQDDRMVLLRNQDSFGVSKARNIGIDAARGKYITFLDSDDYADSDMLENLIKKGIETEADLVISGFYHYYNQDGSICNASRLVEGFFLTSALKDDYINIEKEWGISAVVAKLFRAEIIKKQHLKFNENISILEDMIFMSDYLHCTNNYCCISYQGYYYRHYQEPSLTKIYDPNSFNALERKLEADQWILDMLDDDKKSFYYDRMDILLWSIIKRLYNSNCSEKYKISELKSLCTSQAYGQICKFATKYKSLSKRKVLNNLITWKAFWVLHLILTIKMRG